MKSPDGVSIHMGFPNPAADRSLQGLDLHKLLVHNPSSTFFMRLSGNNWEEQGIFDGDIIIIDRALSLRPRDLAVITKNSDFLITRGNKVPQDCQFWGVVTTVIHQTRQK